MEKNNISEGGEKGGGEKGLARRMDLNTFASKRDSDYELSIIAEAKFLQCWNRYRIQIAIKDGHVSDLRAKPRFIWFQKIALVGTNRLPVKPVIPNNPT